MDDAEFLEACGVAIDQRWLVESACIGIQPEARRYAMSLLKIAALLGSPVEAAET
jgi:hypothetical protein